MKNSEPAMVTTITDHEHECETTGAVALLPAVDELLSTGWPRQHEPARRR